MQVGKEQNFQNRSDIKILVVDDREDNLFSIETILEKDNYTIVKANSGRSALKTLLKEDDFSLILMDVQMPDINGFETATIIYERDKLKNIPIIFITAHNYGEEYVFKGYKTGGVDYIYKPFNPELLRAKVSVFAELYRKNKELVANEKKLRTANIALQKEIEERKISEQKITMLNKQLVNNNNELKAINEELDRFAFVASHDLQEPLRKIMLFSDKILMKNTDEEISGYLQKIVNSSQRMQTLIDDILRFSRHNVYSADFIESELDILVGEAISEMEIEIEKNQAQINVHSLPKVPVIPVLIHQLFYNLISNAIKFRKQDSTPVINIYSEKINCSEIIFPVLVNKVDYYKISIEDNGIGFDSNYAEDIFVVFKRLHSYHEYEGTGVGLSICKKIIEKHNGIITAASKKNKGSTFTVWLPEKQIH